MTAEQQAGESWSTRQRKGQDAAWRVLYGFGVNPITAHRATPPFLTDLAVAVAQALRDPLFAVIDRMDVTLDSDARQRIFVEAVADTAGHTIYSITSAIGNELARPEPLPFSPPPAGSWVRCRLLPRGR